MTPRDTMTQHTKGPWEVKQRVEVFGTIPIRCGDSGKPPLVYVVDLPDPEEQQANAALIAAAPALYEALKQAIQSRSITWTDPQLIDKALEAIRLAEGRP